jgi:hypothetical protein
METNPWEERRKNDPQGLIDDMCKTATKQGQEINRLNKEIERLKSLLPPEQAAQEGVPVKPPKKPRAKATPAKTDVIESQEPLADVDLQT